MYLDCRDLSLLKITGTIDTYLFPLEKKFWLQKLKKLLKKKKPREICKNSSYQ